MCVYRKYDGGIKGRIWVENSRIVSTEVAAMATGHKFTSYS